MKNDELEQLFSSLKMDVLEPVEGHRDRFKDKLEQKDKGQGKSINLFPLWPSLLGLAAILLVGLFLFPGLLVPSDTQKRDLASVSDEMKETQNFYTAVIQQELQALQDVRSPETDRMIQDALAQLENLEADYEKLKTDLVNSGNDQRVIFAMVSNFQKRMDLLNKLLEKIQYINDYNSSSHENDYL